MYLLYVALDKRLLNALNVDVGVGLYCDLTGLSPGAEGSRGDISNLSRTY